MLKLLLNLLSLENWALGRQCVARVPRVVAPAVIGHGAWGRQCVAVSPRARLSVGSIRSGEPAREVTNVVAPAVMGHWAWGMGNGKKCIPNSHCPLPIAHCPLPNSQLPFSCGSARTDYAIATDALSCQDYQSVSNKTNTCIKY
jgi:hypothetical protein